MIILIRHATPLIEYSRCKSLEAHARLEAYNTTETLKFDEVLPYQEELCSLLSDFPSTEIYTSNLPRAIHTARYLFEPLNSTVTHDAVFREFGLGILNIPLVRIRPNTWFALSRIAWFFGVVSSQVPSFRQERKRAKRAAKQLIDSHTPESAVVLVGHGLMNRFIKRALKKENWHPWTHKKNGCFEIQCFSPHDRK